MTYDWAVPSTVFDFVLADKINRYVNNRVRWVADWEKFHRIDLRANPLKDGDDLPGKHAATLEKGTGDCEDFEEAKSDLLLTAGWPRDQLGFWYCYGNFGGIIGGHAINSIYIDTPEGRQEWLGDCNLPTLERVENTEYQLIKRFDYGLMGWREAQSWKNHPVMMT